MNTTGLIVEYNPFHNGHLYHLNSSKERTKAEFTVAVMSGNFVQRGEPALFDKFSRAKAAVRGGVDLVFELPALYATQTAEIFAYGSVLLLNSIGCIDSICFGSESGSTDIIGLSADILSKEPDFFREKLSDYLKSGMLFASARSNALFDYIEKFNPGLIEEDRENFISILNSSNNILGLEYIKSLIKLNSDIKPFTIERKHSKYNSQTIDGEIASATSIRNSFYVNTNKDVVPENIKNCIPETTYDILSEKISDGFYPVFSDDFFERIVSIILRDRENIKNIFDISEGIENRIIKSALTAVDMRDLEEKIKTKRYTMTRVKRCLNNILLGITKEDVKRALSLKKLPYVRILAFNDKGREIIKNIKKSSDIKIINRFSEVDHFMDDDNFRLLIGADIKCSDIYNSVYYRKNRNLLKGSMDYFIKPKYIKE